MKKSLFTIATLALIGLSNGAKAQLKTVNPNLLNKLPVLEYPAIEHITITPKTATQKVTSTSSYTVCDTARHISATDTITLYTTGTGTAAGYFMGTNPYGFTGLAESYALTDFPAGNLQVTGAIILFYRQSPTIGTHSGFGNTGMAATLSMVNSSTNPAAAAAATAPFTYADLNTTTGVTNVNYAGNPLLGYASPIIVPYVAMFTTPVPLTSNFFLSLTTFDHFTYDTIALFSGRQGHNATNTAWVNYSGTWSTFTSLGTPNEALAIFPIVSCYAAATNTNTICAGATATLTANFGGVCGGGYYNYSWNTGQTTPSITVSPTTTTIYSVTASDTCGPNPTQTFTVTVIPAPNVMASSASICSGGLSATLTASGASTYTWSANAGSVNTTNIVVNPTVTTDYTVTGTDANGCTGTAIGEVAVASAPRPEICMVSTDSTTNYQYNIIYWDKTLYSNVDSFIVYRYDAGSGNYLRIGAVSNSALSEFVDVNRNIGGPNGGDPTYAGWKYKLAILENCGHYSSLSPYHQSMFIQESGANFSWTAYVDSGQVNLPTGYSFLRDDINTGAWHVLANVSTTSATDPNYATYPSGNWRVDALGFTCNPTLRLANGGNNNTYTIRVRSHSNTNRQAGNGIKQYANSNAVSVYPNPASSSLQVTLSGNIQNTTLQITDMLGNTVKQSTIKTSKTSIDVSDLAEGVYQFIIMNSEFTINKRVVIVR